jgi:hypothetical protein
VTVVRTDVSEERIASITRVKKNFFRNVGFYNSYTASHPRRLYTSYPKLHVIHDHMSIAEEERKIVKYKMKLYYAHISCPVTHIPLAFNC